jgi:hypothetical protein
MFRIQHSILDDSTAGHGTDPAPIYRTDADLITTLTAVGFCVGRLAVGHPIEFSWDPSKLEDEQETQDAVAGLRKAVGQAGQHLVVTKAPDWTMGSLITGAAGSASTPFASRHAEPSTEAARQLREIASRDTNVGYQGFGAYTGFVDVPFTNKDSVKSTMRYNVPDQAFGERWRPPAYTYAKDTGLDQTNAPWGLLADGRPIEGMPAMKPVPGGVVGYTHGMIQSIYDAVATGPWCTPFEIAVGSKTTKVASCFACTLFMYAAGFPPSNIHLGRGDSWAPFYPRDLGDQGYSMVVDEGVRSTNTRWALECWQHLRMGVDRAKETTFLGPEHEERLELLDKVLESRANDLFAAANLLLDALTVQDPYARRICRAIPLG